LDGCGFSVLNVFLQQHLATFAKTRKIGKEKKPLDVRLLLVLGCSLFLENGTGG
jgi:hypothetical protein